MSDLKQGINYEITAEDKTQQGTESALANLIKAEKAAKDAANKEKKEANDVKGLFGSVTQAISGNFDALAQRLAKTTAAMKGVKLSGMALGAIGAIVTSIVTIVKALADAWSRVKDRLEKIRLDNVLGEFDRLKKESDAMVASIELQKKNAEAMRDVLHAQVDATKRLRDAQLEYAKAQEMSLAKSDEERELIEEKYKAQGKMSEREYQARKRDMQRKAADDEIRSLEKELQAAKDRENSNLRLSNDYQRQITERGSRGYWATIGDKGRQNLDAIASLGDKRSQAMEAAQEAIRQQQDIQVKIDAAKAKRKTLDVDEKTAQISARATDIKDATTGNLKIKKESDDIKKETEKIKADIERARKEMAALAKKDAEEIAKARAKAEAEAAKQREAAEKAAHDRRKKEIHDEKEAWGIAQNDANTRLAAAQEAVRTAWGWYRDKSAMAAQIEEEKANAEAEKQYERDFERLKRRRRNWETAKNLSVDEEAVKRVAMARQEEEAAQKAVAEINAKMDKVVEELEKITEAE